MRRAAANESCTRGFPGRARTFAASGDAGPSRALILGLWTEGAIRGGSVGCGDVGNDDFRVCNNITNGVLISVFLNIDCSISIEQ